MGGGAVVSVVSAGPLWEGEAPAEPRADWVLVPELVLGGPRG